MEIQNTTGPLLDPYAAGLEKSGETRGRARTESVGSDSARGDTVSVSQDALLLTLGDEALDLFGGQTERVIVGRAEA